MQGFIKPYPTPELAQSAARHHAWLSSHQPLLRVPALLAVEGSHLQFDRIHGRHPGPDELPTIADHLGVLHAGLHRRELYASRLDTPFITGTGLVVADFLSRRRAAVADRLAGGLVPEPGLSAAAADELLTSAVAQPATIYKDSNIRNILITDSGPVHVDFDDLTLAPFGYDLAKLLLSAAMTHGPIALQHFPAATERYDHALTSAGIPPSGPRQIAAWLEIHHILTAPYLHRHGYEHAWNHLRPALLGFGTY